MPRATSLSRVGSCDDGVWPFVPLWPFVEAPFLAAFFFAALSASFFAASAALTALDHAYASSLFASLARSVADFSIWFARRSLP